MANFYNLPSAWNPGFAPYDPAEAEGLERRSIVTQQMRNGTFDEARVKDGGYAVPKYVLKEGYGGGAVVTKWLPRGTVDGNPSWLTKPTSTWSPMGAAEEFHVAISGDDGAASSYGAATLAADPFARYGAAAARMITAKLGRVAPAKRAAALKTVLDKVDPSLYPVAMTSAKKTGSIETGLASAMSSGLRNEVINLGRTKTRPRPRSLLGLGAYGAGPAMGAVLSELGDALSSVTQGIAAAAASSGGGTQQWIEVGPFRFDPAPVPQVRHAVDLTPEWAKWVADQIKKVSVVCQGMQMPPVPASTFGLDKWIGMSGGWMICPMAVGGSNVPLAYTKHPVTKQNWGLYVKSRKDLFEITWRKLDADPLGSAASWIASKLVSAGKDVVGFAGDVLSGLEHLACQAVNGAGVAQAAAATGGAAGVAGAAAASAICTQTPTAPLPPPSSPPMSSSTLLLLGGAAVVGFLLLKKG